MQTTRNDKDKTTANSTATFGQDFNQLPKVGNSGKKK